MIFHKVKLRVRRTWGWFPLTRFQWCLAATKRGGIWKWLKLKMITVAKGVRCLLLVFDDMLNKRVLFPYHQNKDGGLKPHGTRGQALSTKSRWSFWTSTCQVELFDESWLEKCSVETPKECADFPKPGFQIQKLCCFSCQDTGRWSFIHAMFILYTIYILHVYMYIGIYYTWFIYNFCWCHICHTPFPGVGALPSEDIHCDFGVDWFDLKAVASVCAEWILHEREIKTGVVLLGDRNLPNSSGLYGHSDFLFVEGWPFFRERVRT